MSILSIKLSIKSEDEMPLGGGVAFYVKQGIPFKIMKNLSNFVEREFECLNLETTIIKKKSY